MKAGLIQKFHSEDSKEEDGDEQAGKKVEYTNVVKLTTETYNDTIKNNKYVFIEYYSPTCGHCVQFAPEYEALATKLQGEDSKYIIAAVDLEEHAEVGEWTNVNGYPTLRFYINGIEVDYNGPR